MLGIRSHLGSSSFSITSKMSLVVVGEQKTWKPRGNHQGMLIKTLTIQGDLLGETIFINSSRTFWRWDVYQSELQQPEVSQIDSFSRVFGRSGGLALLILGGETTKLKKSQKTIHSAFSRHQKTINICKINRNPRAKLFKWSFKSEHDQTWGGGHIQLVAQDIPSCPTWRSSSSWCLNTTLGIGEKIRFTKDVECTWCFISMSKIHNLSPQSRCWLPLILVVYAIPCSRSQLMRFDPTSNSPPPKKKKKQTKSPSRPHFDY